MLEALKKTRGNITESARKIWLAGLGAVAKVEEEGSSYFDELVNKGEEFNQKNRDKAQEKRDELEEALAKMEEDAGERFEKLMKDIGVPTRSEIEELNKKVDELNKALREQAKAA